MRRNDHPRAIGYCRIGVLLAHHLIRDQAQGVSGWPGRAAVANIYDLEAQGAQYASGAVYASAEAVAGEALVRSWLVIPGGSLPDMVGLN
jgi:hypothetical protein